MKLVNRIRKIRIVVIMLRAL